MVAWQTELFGESLKTKAGTASTEEALVGKKLVGVYFSAHWCPPCRGFTPILAEFYNDVKKRDASNLEIIFITSDRDEASFNDYYSSMPWLALEHSNQSLIKALKEKFGVRGIPTFVILNGETGEIIDASARNTVTESNGDLDDALSQWGVSA